MVCPDHEASIADLKTEIIRDMHPPQPVPALVLTLMWERLSMPTFDACDDVAFGDVLRVGG